jgi:SAM-dependent methyltransferase
MNNDAEQTVIRAARASFAEESKIYAEARPTYPEALFAWLSNIVAQHDQCWDCATGNGQAAIGLAPYFRQVYATDISPEQIAHAVGRENITYRAASAEESGFAHRSFDLITVAQALHWFDFPKFWAEIKRVSKPGAVFCAWGYDWPNTTPMIESEFVKPFCEIIQPFWASNNQILWNGYKTEEILFPFRRIDVPQFSIRAVWTFQQLKVYMTTWSACKRSRNDAAASAALDALVADISNHVTDETVLPIEMELKSVAGYVTPDSAE